MHFPGRYSQTSHHAGTSQERSSPDWGYPSQKEAEEQPHQVKVCTSWVRKVKGKNKAKSQRKSTKDGSHMREERQEEKYLGDLIHTEEDQTYLRRTAEKKKVLRTTVQGDETKINSGQREATPVE